LAVALFVLAPACYVLLLTAWSAWPDTTKPRRSLIALIIIGAGFGTLFCTLAFGPLGILYIIEFRQIILEPSELVQIAIASALILAHGAMFGGVLGGIVGLVRDLIEWRQRSSQLASSVTDERDY